MRASKSETAPDFDHPGLLLGRDVLPGLGLSVKQAAVDLGITRQTLHRILAGTAAITPGMAIRLERLTDISAALWVSLQAHHHLRRAETEHASKVTRIPHYGLPCALAKIIERHLAAVQDNPVRPISLVSSR
jgi:addiction module HigA family antidote